MYKRLFRLVLFVLLIFSAQDQGFCNVLSTLRDHENEERDYVRYPFITTPEEVDPTLEQLRSEYGSNLSAAAYLAENVVTPWILNNEPERHLFLNLLDSDECSDSFLKYYRQIRDAAISCSNPSSNQTKPLSSNTLKECIKEFSFPDKKKQYAIRETLIQLFADMVENYGWGEDTLKDFLSYEAKKGSIYAEYEITRDSIRMSLGQYGVCSTDQMMKKSLAKSNYTRAHKSLKDLILKLPSIGGEPVFELAAMTGFALEKDTKENVSFLKEAINRHYSSIERYPDMKKFMTISNHYYHMQAIGYTRLGIEENASEEKRKRYWHKALTRWESIYDKQDKQLQEEDLNSIFARSNLYQEIGNHEKAHDLLAKWQTKRANQLKEAQAALAKKRATQASLIKNDIQNKIRQEREFTAKPPLKEHRPHPVTQTQPITDAERYSPISVSPSLPREIREEKIKVKRKGMADLSKTKRQPQKAIEQIEEVRSNQIRIEDLLKEGSKYYRRFCELFSIYEEDTQGVKAISISMHQASKLLDRIQLTLNTRMGFGSQAKSVDPSKGKGSHAKGEISNGIEKVVITLSKKNTLLPYQIQSLVGTFIQLGYYPHYLEDRLNEKGILHSTHKQREQQTSFPLRKSHRG